MKIARSALIGVMCITIIIATFAVVPNKALADSNFLGSGTQEDPYLIQNAEDLTTLAGLVNTSSSTYADKFYLQTQDIDLSEVDNWDPIGNSSVYHFKGIYDGGGHKITGLSILSSTQNVSYKGLFGYVASGTIKNVELADGSINIEYSYSAYIGGIAGYVINGTIENCVSNVNITVTIDMSYIYSGGIVGEADSNSVISGCTNSGDIMVSNNSEVYVGGIIGNAKDNVNITGCANKGCINAKCYKLKTGGITGFFDTASNPSSVSQCYNIGSITGYGSDSVYIGGIIGNSHTDDDIVNCFNTGVMSGKTDDDDYNYVGGICGYGSSTIQKCYNIGQLTGVSIGGISGGYNSYSDCYYADTCQQGSINKLTGKSTLEELKQQSTFAGFDFSTVWTLSMTEVTGYDFPQLQNTLLYASDKTVELLVDSGMGTVQGAGEYAFLDTVTISATPNAPFPFNRWEVLSGGVVLADPTASTTTFVMHMTDVVVRAVFEGGNVVLTDNGYGTAEGAGSYGWGDTVNITATADHGYKFINWNVISGDVELSDTETITASFVMPESDVTIEAIFDIPPEYTYTVQGGGARITHYTGTDSVVVVPDRLGEYPVTEIWDCAFGFLDSLTSITIPDTVVNINEKAFFCSDAITEIQVSSDNSCYKDLDGVLYNKTGTELIYYPAGKLGPYAIQAGVTEIGDYAFRNCSFLTSVEIPNSVTDIGNYAFYGCSGLVTVELPVGVTDIGNNAFYECTNITSINIPNSVTNIGNHAFYECGKLTSIKIPGSVTTIQNTFVECDSLVDVDLGEGIETIGESAFCGCSSLRSIDMPTSVVSIEDSAFAYCGSLKSVYFWDTPPTLGNDVFKNVGYDFKAYYHVTKSSSWVSYWGTKKAFCILTKDMQDGQAPELSRAPLTNLRLSEPEEPVRTDHIFGGWFKEKEYINAWNFDTDAVTDDITLYALWEYTGPIPVSSVTLSSESETMHIDDTVTLIVEVLPDDATYPEVTWSSSNTDIATVDESGLITAVGLGEATITATADGVSDTCVITVEAKPVSSVTLSSESETMHIDDTVTLTAQVQPDDATYPEVTWSSSDTDVATVDQNGFVTAIGYGEATITATADGVSDTCVITVVEMYGDDIIDGKLNRSYYNGDGLLNRVAIYYGSDDSTGIWKISYYENGVQTSYEEYNTSGNIISKTYLYSSGVKRKTYWYSTTTGNRYAISYYNTSGKITYKKYLYSTGVTKRTYWYSTSTGKRYAISEYNTSGKITEKTYLYSSGVKKITYWYSTSTGKKYAISEYNTSGKITQKTYLYSSGVKRKTYWYSSTTSKRYAISYYNTSGNITLKTYLYSSGVKKRNYWYSAETGKRYAISEYNTSGKITEKTYLYSNGVKKKTYWYSTSTGKRYAISYYGTNGKITHKKYLYTSGVTKKTYWYSKTTGKRYAISYYDTNGDITKKVYYNTDGSIKETIYY